MHVYSCREATVQCSTHIRVRRRQEKNKLWFNRSVTRKSLKRQSKGYTKRSKSVVLLLHYVITAAKIINPMNFPEKKKKTFLNPFFLIFCCCTQLLLDYIFILIKSLCSNYFCKFANFNAIRNCNKFSAL